MSEKEKPKTAQSRVVQALHDNVYADRSGNLYSFQGICAETSGSYENSYIFWNHYTQKQAPFSARKLEDLVEVRNIQDLTNVRVDNT